MVTRPPGADGVLRLVVNASRKDVDFALMRERLPAGRPADAASRAGADRASGASGGRDFGEARAERGARDHGVHERETRRASRNSTLSFRAPATRAKTATRSRSRRRRRRVSPAPYWTSPTSRRSASARAIRSGSRRAFVSTVMSSMRRQTRSKPLSPGQSKSADVSKAAFPAPSELRMRWRMGRTVGASA